ncbi:hypothetical protein COCVIDRAFT_107800, partial [Bipolaris victoriae FI3]
RQKVIMLTSGWMKAARHVRRMLVSEFHHRCMELSLWVSSEESVLHHVVHTAIPPM